MKFTCNKSLLALALTVSACVLPAQAHELRYIGNSYLLQVGDDVEPPVAGQLNGVDFLLFTRRLLEISTQQSLLIEHKAIMSMLSQYP